MVTIPSKPARNPSHTYSRDLAALSRARTLTSQRSHVFIAFDLKWLEDEPNTILEIGMATLDLRPGFLRPARYPPSTWAIRPRHIIISENLHVFNTRHAKSNKFGFKFGKPYYARLAKAIAVINETLSRYPTEQIVLVGQFIVRDLKKLRELGVEIPVSWPVFDVANLDRAAAAAVNGRRRGLGDICEELDIKYFREDKLGNAGNDAWFAMAAFVAICCS
jgi:hypothetical protein